MKKIVNNLGLILDRKELKNDKLRNFIGGKGNTGNPYALVACANQNNPNQDVALITCIDAGYVKTYGCSAYVTCNASGYKPVVSAIHYNNCSVQTASFVFCQRP